MKRFVYLLAILLLPALVSAQVIRAEPTQISVGGGSMLAEENMTFSWEAAFGAIHWHGVELFGRNGTTGVGVEIHPAAVLSFSEGNIRLSQMDQVDWRLWSLNRVKVSALQLPGEIWEKMYLGSDFLIYEGGSTDYTGDFTARFVFGVKEKAGPGWLDFEFYMFEKYRPISFAVFYRYNF
jgi:hypothetical protein